MRAVSAGLMQLKMNGGLHMLDVVLKHDEVLIGLTHYNVVAPNIYARPEVNELLNEKAEKNDLDDYDSKSQAFAKDEVYSKTEADQLLNKKADKTELIESYTKNETDELLDEKVNEVVLDDYHSQTETYAKIETYNKIVVDSFLDEKVDIGTLYIKSDDDEILILKADKTDLIDSYSKTEDDELVLLKADRIDLIDSYSKSEDDSLLLLKADKTDLNNFVDLTFAQTVSGQKQFGVIRASSISKQSKNDVSILLAGGGDILVSTLVNQTELLEIGDIATGKSKGYVFATADEMNTWIEDQENVSNLVIGDNLNIVDKEVTDYCWDGTNLRMIEIELPDMSNVVTTLGTATGNGNTITDISIDEKVLNPAKNISFVTNNYDESIAGYRTFNTTNYSVGIMVQTQDYNSVVCAGGGVKAISDITAKYYNKSVTYSQIETNNLLSFKAKTGVSYTKEEDDVLLFLKTDKTQLTDSYSKIETNNLLNNKANNGASYSKGEDDALLLLKTNKTQLIDSYTKGETNNL
ncbi:MAG: hypothetical protein EZS28_020642 [Streblomastix strix]|uniref:Uncharacterized protein n=1 Tax=Streblomastix strix TaxID=222440 RepID=A0A5J4VMX8_9EUKA|nr:MAG: hypothetical protein EZS28_020642 [Streblomastix strix]